MLSPDEIAAARARHPIVDVLARFGTHPPDRWNGSSDFMVCCPCPGHADRTPSCIVHPSTDRYYCFGCGAHGDVLQLVRDVDGITSLRQAVEFLDSGRISRPIDITPRSFAARPSDVAGLADRPDPARTPLERVLGVNAAAWQVLTADSAAELARRYLAGRGIDIPPLEGKTGHPLAGYTPASRAGLVDRLRAAGFGDDEIVDAGWGIRRDRVMADRFRRRVVLPIRDDDGRIVGVAGRDITGTARHKYLNTPATVAFHKGACLYRPTCEPLRRASTVIVCEGTLDALAIATQASALGLHSRVVAVAPSGTALTPRQATLIAASAPAEVILCADGDDAGHNAAKNWRELLIDARVPHRPWLVRLPAHHDPASWLQAFRADGLRAILTVALSDVVEV